MISITPFITDLASGQNVQQLKDATKLLTLPKEPDITAVVDQGKHVRSVVFTLDGRRFTANSSPYRAGCGDFLREPGAKKLNIAAYSEEDGKGNCLKGTTLSFTVPANVVTPTKCEIGLVTQTNQDEAPIDRMMPLFQRLGIRTIRTMLWLEDWSKAPTSAGDLKLYAQAGLDITMTITCKKVPKTTTIVSDAMARIHDAYAPYVKRFAVMNEPDLKSYWDGTLQQAMELVMQPAYRELKRRKAIVLGPAVSEGPNELAQLIKFGYLNCCDEVCFHPYQRDEVKHEAVLAQVAAMIGGKPLNITEWNIHAPSSAAWVKAFPAMRAAVQRHARRAYYYRSLIKPDRPAGKQALFLTDFTPNEPYLSTFMENR